MLYRNLLVIIISLFILLVYGTSLQTYLINSKNTYSQHISKTHPSPVITPKPSPEPSFNPSPMPVISENAETTNDLEGLNFPIMTKAEVSISVIEATHYYDISGTTADNLYDQMRNLGPKTADGHSAIATTEPTYGIDGFPRSVEDLCAPGQTKITIQIVYTYPRWINQTEAPAELSGKWDNFLSATRAHELGHKNITMEYGNELAAGVESIPPVNCMDLQTRIDSLMDSITNRHQQAQLQFEQQTNYGLAQAPSLY